MSSNYWGWAIQYKAFSVSNHFAIRSLNYCISHPMIELFSFLHHYFPKREKKKITHVFFCMLIYWASLSVYKAECRNVHVCSWFCFMAPTVFSQRKDNTVYTRTIVLFIDSCGICSKKYFRRRVERVLASSCA